MRTLKFRAWRFDKNNSDLVPKMIYQEGMKQNGLPIFGQEWERANDLIFMQFTGLTDSKGIEIYEGDLMTLRKPDREWKQKYLEVFWDNQLNGFSMRSIEKEHLYQTPIMEEDYIVIGNIYEDGALLK